MPGKQQQQQQDEQDLQQLKQLIPGLNGGGGANVSQVRREEMSTIRGILQKLASKISEILAPPGVWRNRTWIHMNLGSKLVKDPKNITKCTVKFVLKSQAMSTELQERMGPNLRELAPRGQDAGSRNLEHIVSRNSSTDITRWEGKRLKGYVFSRTAPGRPKERRKRNPSNASIPVCLQRTSKRLFLGCPIPPLVAGASSLSLGKAFLIDSVEDIPSLY